MGLCMCRPRLARDHVSLLVHVPLFAELGPADLAAVASQVTVERFAKGECVFAESDLGDCMYVVASGRVRVTAQDVEGQDQLLAEWHPPMFFGEMSLLRDGKRAATVVSMSSRTALLCLTRAKLMQCAKQPWARHVLSRLQDTASHRMAQHLREVEFLAGLDANQLGTLASLCSLLRLAQGCYVFRAGDKGDAFYIVLRGRVEVMTQDAAGQERHLVTMGSGHYFGEMSLLDNIPRTASVRAQEPASLLALPADAFRNFLNLAPELRPRLQATVRHRSAGQLKDLQLPLFHGLTDQQLLALGDACTTRAVPAGELALQQGKPASEFHIVVHGSLQVEVAGAAGEPARVVSTLGAGDYFGEISILQKRLPTASVRATVNSTTLRFSAAQFMQLFASNPVALADFLLRMHPQSFTLAMALVHPTVRAALSAHLESEFSSEALDFFLDSQQLLKAPASTPEQLLPTLRTLCSRYIVAGAPKQVNIKDATRRATEAEVAAVEAAVAAGGDRQELITLARNAFALAREEVFKLIERDSFPRFKTSPSFTGAATAHKSYRGVPHLSSAPVHVLASQARFASASFQLDDQSGGDKASLPAPALGQEPALGQGPASGSPSSRSLCGGVRRPSRVQMVPLSADAAGDAASVAASGAASGRQRRPSMRRPSGMLARPLLSVEEAGVAVGTESGEGSRGDSGSGNAGALTETPSGSGEGAAASTDAVSPTDVRIQAEQARMRPVEELLAIADAMAQREFQLSFSRKSGRRRLSELAPANAMLSVGGHL